MKDFILFIWQLPQNILGLFVICFSNAWSFDRRIWFVKYRFGVSLGQFIIIWKDAAEQNIKHEQGHQKQSLYLGPLYLILIGVPSFLGNIIFRLFNINKKYYYKLPWENWADKLGGVRR